MPRRLTSLIGVSAVSLIAAAAFTSSATAQGEEAQVVHHGSASVTKVHPDKNGNCYGNLHDDSGTGVVSQTFGDNPDLNSYGATNFEVQKTCKVTSVYAIGVYFNGSGPADSETVTFYADDAGAPGEVTDSQTAIGTDDNGTFTIPLETVALSPGKHWVSVSANMNLTPGGEWGWELSTHVKRGIEGQFENPGGGFGVCPTWGSLTECVGVSGDFMVQLRK